MARGKRGKNGNGNGDKKQLKLFKKLAKARDYEGDWRPGMRGRPPKFWSDRMGKKNKKEGKKKKKRGRKPGRPKNNGNGKASGGTNLKKFVKNLSDKKLTKLRKLAKKEAARRAEAECGDS